MDDDVLSRLPEWHKILRELYAGVENEQNKSRPVGAVRDQTE
jgi:hypothetical protein